MINDNVSVGVQGGYFCTLMLSSKQAGQRGDGRMKLKKILALVLCGAITVGLLGGCSGSEDKKEEDGSKKEAKGGLCGERNRRTVGRRGNLSRQLFKRGKEAGSIYPDRRRRACRYIHIHSRRKMTGKKQKKFGSKSGSM